MTTSDLRKEIVKRVDCTNVTNPFKVSVRNRQGKIYVNTIGVDKDDVQSILERLAGQSVEQRYTDNQKVRLTSGSWPSKDFTFRILI
jgi:stage III sporulation protein SpoIIIAA